MAVKVKDIRLKPVIGTWYEYQPGKYNADFNPGNLELSQIDEVLELHYKWALGLTELIATNLAISAQLNETKIIQQKYSEFLSDYSENTVSFNIEIAPGLELTFVLEARLAFGLINRAVGGKGLSKKNSDLTEIEIITLNTILEPLLAQYQKNWFNSLKIADSQDLTAPKLKIDDRIRKDSEVFVLENHIVIGEGEPVKATVLFAQNVLEALMDKYQQQKLIQPKKITVMLSPDSVKNVKVPVRVKIGTTTVAMNDIMSLEEGDIFQLNEKLSDSVYFSINEDSEFYGVLGLKNKRYAVKVLEKKPQYYEMPGQEQPVIIQGNIAESEVQVQEEVGHIEEQHEDVVDQEQVEDIGDIDVDKIEIKDDLLEEFKDEKTESHDEEFTWDIDDLK